MAAIVSKDVNTIIKTVLNNPDSQAESVEVSLQAPGDRTEIKKRPASHGGCEELGQNDGTCPNKKNVGEKDLLNMPWSVTHL